VAGFFIILCGALLIILPAMKWTKRCREAKNKIVSTTTLKRNGVPQQNNLIHEENGDLQTTDLFSTCSVERDSV